MSQGEKRILIPAGAEGFPVRAAGDFIFLRSASAPLRVLIDGQPITMEAGEKRVVKRKNPVQPAFDSFQVDNLTGAPLAAVFVVGEGDYEKIIVSGELNVSAFVTSGRGESASLPFEVTKRVGLVDGISIQQLDGTVNLMAGTTITDAGGSDDMFMFWYENAFWRMHNTGLVKYADDFLSVAETRAIAGVPSDIADQDWVGGGITESGQIYFWTKAASGANSIPTVYTCHIDEMVISRITTSTMEGMTSNWSMSRQGTGVYGSRVYYWLDPDNTWVPSQYRNSFAFYDFISGNRGYVPIKGAPFSFSGSSAGVWSTVDPAGYLCVGLDQGGSSFGYPSGSYARFDLDGNFVDVKTFDCGSFSGLFGNFQAICISGNKKYVAFTGTGERAFHFESKTIYGTVYAQDGDDTSTRKTYDLESPINALPAAGGNYVVKGGLVRAVLNTMLDFGKSAGTDYLDYLTAVGFTDKNGVKRRYDSGTKTLHGRGISDYEMPIVIDGDLTLSILPEFFE